MIWKIARAGFALGVLLIFPSAPAQTAPLLRDVKTVQVDSTVVSDPEKVKEEAAANLVQDSLRNALRSDQYRTRRQCPNSCAHCS